MAGSTLRHLVGQPSTLGGGKRAWCSALYAPGGGYKLYRITCKEETDAGTWEWTSRTASTEDEARELFARVETALSRTWPAAARGTSPRRLVARRRLPGQLGLRSGHGLNNSGLLSRTERQAEQHRNLPRVDPLAYRLGGGTRQPVGERWPDRVP
jgi:hypothetical protein